MAQEKKLVFFLYKMMKRIASLRIFYACARMRTVRTKVTVFKENCPLTGNKDVLYACARMRTVRTKVTVFKENCPLTKNTEVFR